MEKGTIVQIVNANNRWFPSLIIVDEIKNWGIQGYIIIPTNDEETNHPAYVRIETNEFEIVGKAFFIIGDGNES